MSRSHFIAILPLFSILTMSPIQIEAKFASRTIASEVISAHPKYEVRAAKIDRSKIEIDKDLDLACFSERGEALRTRLLQERKNYKVDLVEKDAVAGQRARVEGLIKGLVNLEVDMAALKVKKAWGPIGEEIANKTMAELKTTLESLLQDEVENELVVLKDKIKKEEVPVVVKDEPKEEEKEKTEEEQKICDLEDQNEVLSKQIKDLLDEQKKIMDSMLGMSNMMVQMNQQMQQQQYSIPSWLMSGPSFNPYTYGPMSPPTIIMLNSSPLGPSYGPLLGQQNYQQNLQSGQYQYPQQQQPQYQSYNQPGTFGSGDLSYNFGPGATNKF